MTQCVADWVSLGTARKRLREALGDCPPWALDRQS